MVKAAGLQAGVLDADVPDAGVPDAGVLDAGVLAGVLGAGVFGAFHARKYASLDGVRLAGVYDPDLVRAERLAGETGARAFDDLEALLAAVDVVTVATPAHTHAALAQQALAAGRHVYVEKPLAISIPDGEALVQGARDRRLVLACGHQERVVFSAMGLLDAPERPLLIQSVRRGTPNERNRDVSCVLDLMIHDLDLALAVCGEPLNVSAQGGFDAVSASVAFPDGGRAVFEASRSAERRERTMRVVYPSGAVEIDFLAPSFANTAGFALNAAFATTPDGADPLGASVSAFLRAVGGEAASRPAVSGEEGLRALSLALEIERAAGL